MAGQPIGPTLSGPGELGNTDGWAPGELLNTVLSSAIGILSVVAGVWFLFLLITGAISYMQAGGDQNKVDAAQKKITTGVIGIIAVFAAVFIADFVGYIFDIDILNPGNFILRLAP